MNLQAAIKFEQCRVAALCDRSPSFEDLFVKIVCCSLRKPAPVNRQAPRLTLSHMPEVPFSKPFACFL